MLYGYPYDSDDQEILTHDQIIASIQCYHDELNSYFKDLKESQQRLENHENFKQSDDLQIEYNEIEAQVRVLENLTELHSEMFDSILCRKGL